MQLRIDYNDLGQRISRKEISGSSTNIENYVHDGVNIVADLDEDKELLKSYAYSPGYDNIISMTTYGDETNTYFYIRNHNNSVVALIDQNGDIAESYEYSAYGSVKVFDANGNEQEKSVFGNRYTFQGREIDYTTGLYNFRSRWYDAETGRWLSKDPIGINGGLNQYVFCGNNPVMFGDPEGLEVYVHVYDSTYKHMSIILCDPKTNIYTEYGLMPNTKRSGWKAAVELLFFANLGTVEKKENISFDQSFVDIYATKDEEEKMKQLLEDAYNKQKSRYNYPFMNCSSFVESILKEAGYLPKDLELLSIDSPNLILNMILLETISRKLEAY